MRSSHKAAPSLGVRLVISYLVVLTMLRLSCKVPLVSQCAPVRYSMVSCQATIRPSERSVLAGNQPGRDSPTYSTFAAGGWHWDPLVRATKVAELIYEFVGRVTGAAAYGASLQAIGADKTPAPPRALASSVRAEAVNPTLSVNLMAASRRVEATARKALGQIEFPRWARSLKSARNGYFLSGKDGLATKERKDCGCRKDGESTLEADLPCIHWSTVPGVEADLPLAQ